MKTKPNRRVSMKPLSDTQIRMMELKAEHKALSERYDRDYAAAFRFSERSADAYMDTPEGKRLIERIIEIDQEYSRLSQL